VHPDDAVLGTVGGRLRALRQSRSLTLAQLAAVVEVSESTLSRLESGRLRPTLAQLLPLARFYGLSLDGLVDPLAAEPRTARMQRFHRDGASFVRLSSRPGGVQAYRMSYRAETAPAGPVRCSHRHEGFLSVSVLTGRLRVIVGHRDLVLAPGEAAEFDTGTPHGLAAVDRDPIEAIMLFGAQGERIRTVAAPAIEAGVLPFDGPSEG
jgi:transcriptional regulator with XRE-family HTH domain